MSFFGGTKHGKISTQKKLFQTFKKREQNLVWNQTLNTFNHKLKTIQFQLFDQNFHASDQKIDV
jgi:hypothetical protein